MGSSAGPPRRLDTDLWPRSPTSGDTSEEHKLGRAPAPSRSPPGRLQQPSDGSSPSARWRTVGAERAVQTCDLRRLGRRKRRKPCRLRHRGWTRQGARGVESDRRRQAAPGFSHARNPRKQHTQPRRCEDRLRLRRRGGAGRRRKKRDLRSRERHGPAARHRERSRRSAAAQARTGGCSVSSVSVRARASRPKLVQYCTSIVIRKP